jgi:L-fuconolactonase
VRIDSHHHLWDPTRASYPWLTDDLAVINRTFTTQDLRIATEANGVDATVLVQTRGSVDETIEFLQTEDPVVGVIGWVDLTAPDVADVIAQLMHGPNGHRLVGIRHQTHDEADADWLDRADVRRGIEAVASAGLVFDLLVRARELPAATRLVAALPQCQFVLDHLAKPPLTEAADSSAMAAWSAALRSLAAHSNVAAKVSGLVTEADWHTWTPADLRPATDVALEAFGPDRLMFGSDWPVSLLAASYSTVVETFDTMFAHLSPTELTAMQGINAQRVYKLDLNPRHSGATKL